MRSILWKRGILFLSLFCVISFSTSALVAAIKSPESEITVKDYKWGSGGAGTVGIIKELTLENKGKTTYKNVEVEADLYSRDDIPLGSLRSTIHDLLPAGTEKTFYNVNFGFMHSQLEKTVVRIVGAETLETLGLPKDLIAVKSWEWTGSQYGTEGILKEITLENKGGTNYKDIEIQLEYFSPSGEKLGPTVAVIHDVIPAKSIKTFYNINVGFKQPQIKKTVIIVADASRAPIKKPKPSLVKRDLPIENSKKKPTTKAGQDITATTNGKQTKISALPKESGSTKNPEGAKKENLQQTQETSSVSPQEEEEKEPTPKEDIIVKDFKWGGGITGTIGIVRELTLENKSDITYSNIELTVDFYSRSDRRLLGSNRVIIRDVLPANSEKTFRDIKAGFLSVFPEEIEIKIVNAVVVR